MVFTLDQSCGRCTTGASPIQVRDWKIEPRHLDIQGVCPISRNDLIDPARLFDEDCSRSMSFVTRSEAVVNGLMSHHTPVPR
jgi:hypothetical protein